MLRAYRQLLTSCAIFLWMAYRGWLVTDLQ
jgi:hypothetical protein